MKTKRFFLLAALVAGNLMGQDAAPDKAQGPRFADEWTKALNWRSIGPASMGGRIVDLAMVENDPVVFYMATASGGLFKTTNGGTTFAPVFEREATVSIGDVAVSASNPNVVWVGTGEHNGRNSVSWGDGVYKSTDGGKSWTNMGLKKSFSIGRIAIHPENPDIVYVGAVGRLWGPNEQRGLFKTTDGGKSWEKILYVDEKTGCIEVQMHPSRPDTLLVGMYERQRDAFDGGDPAKRWGPGSGLYKTTDGGKSFKKLSKGLPSRAMGRIGVSWFKKNPRIVYSIIETDQNGVGPAVAFMGINGGNRVKEAVIQGVTKDGPSAKAGIEAGDVVTELDGKKIASYNDLIVAIRAHKPKDTVKLKVKRGEEVKEMELTFGQRGGSTGRPYTSYLGGQRANAQKQQGKNGFETGGVFRSEDGGETWVRVNSLNPRPFYYSQIRVDPSDVNLVYVLGISFHVSTDGGKSFKTGGRGVHPDHHALWIDPRDGRHLRLGCDGGLYISRDRGRTWDFHNLMAIGQFYDVGVDTRVPYRVYGGLQDNGSWGGPSRKRGRLGPINSDWLRIGGGDGFICRADPNDPDMVYAEMQYGRFWRVNVATGARATMRNPAPRGKKLRWNWKAPFLLSHQNSKIYYNAGNYVFRSLNRGDKLEIISPEISRTKRGAATALAESPRDAKVLWVGTDDGALWITRDGGKEWKDITKSVGLAGHYQVNAIEASRYADGRAYVAFDGHRSDNDDPHIYVTEDFGATWKAINANLPTGSTRCVREDVVNENLLYCGAEFGIWASLDRGGHWTRINNNLPTVSIHEIAVHPTAGEIVAGTHGRSAWILDVTPLRGFTAEAAKAKAHLFKPPSGVLWAGVLSHSRSGHRLFAGQNPAFGSAIYYHLAKDAKSATLEIRDARGNAIRRLRVDKKAGLHATRWDLRGVARRPGPRPPATKDTLEDLFKRFDKDKDGKLTQKDAKGVSSALLKRILERSDKNEDGVVTKEEFRAAPGQLAGGTSRPAPPLNRAGNPVKPGTYVARLVIDGQEFLQEIKVQADPKFPAALLQEELEETTRKQRPEFIE
jgi:photosystem II stability/assembly factor-like uncharacterized protein